MTEVNRVAVIGLGYVGLPTAAALAGQGVEVVGVDVDQRVVDCVSEGTAPFDEPDLTSTLNEAVSAGMLSASTEMPQADAYIVAVPTPIKEDSHVDLAHVRSATEAIAPRLRDGEVVILESTVPPGTTRLVSEWLERLRPDLDLPHRMDSSPGVHVAHCPERVLPGRIMTEIVTNDRVIGGLTSQCAERAAAIYRIFCRGGILVTDAESAEMAKLVENASRDVEIAFANELSLICDRLGLDVWEIIRMANRHPRVNILQPGPGVGGHCIAVDPWFVIQAAPQQARMMRLAREINDGKPLHVAEQLVAAAGRLREPRIACLGLAFKADVGDLRESPALRIVREVATAAEDAVVDAVEPHVAELPQSLRALDNVRLSGVDEALDRADIVALLVDHQCFRKIKKPRLSGKIVYDTRGMWA
ncbi:UDP-N-acetyl-D-mannosaminuronic acid dehydrogenase [Saccharomonospora amisosensis]|uniref:UDP-N-acetyl-D-mannosaminuronic acid dehydrogenase n=1 Tax=Saccharomonospora amisosensis TaxID=1128677 RepID=A0A7X5ZQ48_9PSEU|nr:UDP-N-acetyl-D-mannosamine dehydrogenase [Saccharomonospora amisosensis]NIJ11424.1 UDP-N-acetyl-D-mannosaminuronic acid dehydrogenase [Saccharomonospora amisosensis]